MALEHWDPLNVYDDPFQADAYDAYLERVGRMLRGGKGAGDVAAYLGEVRTRALRCASAETVDDAFADRVVAWYALEAPAE